jgi:hypothetical protein
LHAAINLDGTAGRAEIGTIAAKLSKRQNKLNALQKYHCTNILPSQLLTLIAPNLTGLSCKTIKERLENSTRTLRLLGLCSIEILLLSRYMSNFLMTKIKIKLWPGIDSKRNVDDLYPLDLIVQNFT